MTQLISRYRRTFTLIFVAFCSLLSFSSWGGVFTISQQALLDKQSANVPLLILDVRTASEYSAGHVPNAVNIPHSEIEQKISLVKKAIGNSKEVVVYCHSGRRAGYAEEILQQADIDTLFHLEGDMIAWKNNNRPLEY